MTDKWQPIETAPRDGTRVLMWDGDIRFVGYLKWGDKYQSDNAGHYTSKKQWIAHIDNPSEHDYEYADTTHWQPLPPPQEDDGR